MPNFPQALAYAMVNTYVQTRQWIGHHVGVVAHNTVTVAKPYVAKAIQRVTPIYQASAQATAAVSQWAREEVINPVYEQGLAATAVPRAWVRHKAEDVVNIGLGVAVTVVFNGVVLAIKTKEKATQIKRQINDRLTADLRERLENARQANALRAQEQQQALQNLVLAIQHRDRVIAGIEVLEGEVEVLEVHEIAAQEAQNNVIAANQNVAALQLLLEQTENEIQEVQQAIAEAQQQCNQAEEEAQQAEMRANQEEQQRDLDIAEANQQRLDREALLEERQQEAQEAVNQVLHAQGAEEEALNEKSEKFDERVDQLRVESSKTVEDLTTRNNLLTLLKREAERHNPILQDFKDKYISIRRTLADLGESYVAMIPSQDSKMEQYINELNLQITSIREKQPVLQQAKVQIEQVILDEFSTITTEENAKSLSLKLFRTLLNINEARELIHSESNRHDALTEYCREQMLIIERCDNSMICAHTVSAILNVAAGLISVGILSWLFTIHKPSGIENVWRQTEELSEKMSGEITSIDDFSLSSGLMDFLQQAYTASNNEETVQ